MESTIETCVLQCFARKMGMEIEELSLQDTVKAIINDEHYLLSHILLDIHEVLRLNTVDYDANDEFTQFNTVEDIVRYFSSLNVCVN